MYGYCFLVVYYFFGLILGGVGSIGLREGGGTMQDQVGGSQ